MVPTRTPGSGVLVVGTGSAVGNPQMCNVVWRTGDAKDNALELDPAHSGPPRPPFMQLEHL